MCLIVFGQSLAGLQTCITTSNKGDVIPSSHAEFVSDVNLEFGIHESKYGIKKYLKLNTEWSSQ
jgi:hypothetical protein